MKATLLLKKKSSKMIQTRNGDKLKYNLLCQGQRGEQWVGMWDGPEVRAMKEGTNITIDLEQNGKYWNGKPIKADSSEALVEINRKLDEILSILSAKNVDEELPQTEEEAVPSDEEVPF